MSDPKHIGDLKPDIANARKHNPRNVGMIEKSLHEVGAARSIVIDEDDNILAGNATIEAAAQAGIENVQVVDADGETIVAVRRSGLTQRQKVRLSLLDNRTGELADWNVDVLADIMGDDGMLDDLFYDDELEDLLGDLFQPEPPEDPGPRMDRAEELREKWGVETGQLWRLAEHRLICGDCTDRDVVDRVMGGCKAQLVVTDPPYGVGYDGTHLSSGTYFAGGQRADERLVGDDELEIYYRILEQLYRITDNKASIFICFAGAKGYEIYDAVKRSE